MDHETFEEAIEEAGGFEVLIKQLLVALVLAGVPILAVGELLVYFGHLNHAGSEVVETEPWVAFVLLFSIFVFGVPAALKAEELIPNPKDKKQKNRD